MKKFLFILLILISYIVKSQEIKVSQFKLTPLDVSARENKVLDANGDACAIVKARIGIDDVKFTTDLGIRKIEKHDGEYWLWVSPGTKKIKIESGKFLSLEYELPEYTEEYNVYVVFLSLILPDKIVYKDISTLDFSSKPLGADVYVNEIYYGKTPLSINVSEKYFEYKIRKKKFIDAVGSDSVISDGNKYHIKLQKDPNINRLYVMATSGTNSQGGFDFGFNVGQIGKRSWFFLFNMVNQRSKAINGIPIGFFYDEYGDRRYFESVDYDIIHHEDYYFRIRINIGITQRINKFLFGTFGLGYCHNENFGNKEYVFYNSSIGSKFFYPEIKKETYYGVNASLGAILRINNKYLISVNGIHNFEVESGNFTYQVSDWVFGIGYNF